MQRKKIIHSFAVCPKYFFLIPFFCFCLLLQPVYGADWLVPVGKTVGVTLDTEGLLVLGIGSVDGEEPCKGLLQTGDRLLEANEQPLENKEMLMELVEESGGMPVSLQLQRQGREKTVSVQPIYSAADGTYKIGVWIRDSIQGIGTVTCYDPSTGMFGALGHGVYDTDTNNLLEIREGALISAELTEIVKGQKGKAGELTGEVDLQEKMARVEQNTELGIFGIADEAVFAGEPMAVAEISEVKKGEAFLLSDLAGDGVQEYRIQIEEIRKNGGKNHKDLCIRIIDPRLLQLTGGIVQGMSGSPIVQDGKLVGAVTYVLVDDSTRGYGILMEHMQARLQES